MYYLKTKKIDMFNLLIVSINPSKIIFLTINDMKKT